MIQLEVRKEKATAELRDYYMNRLQESYRGSDTSPEEWTKVFTPDESCTDTHTFRVRQNKLRGLRAIEAAPPIHSIVIQFILRCWAEFIGALNFSFVAVKTTAAQCEQKVSTLAAETCVQRFDEVRTVALN